VIRQELEQFVELIIEGETNCDLYEEIGSRLDHLFDANRDEFATDLEFEPLHPLLLNQPAINMQLCGGLTDFTVLAAATYLVDLVSGPPLVFECATTADFASVLGSIFGEANLSLNRIFHHIDIFGPFDVIPPEVILVDTPGLDDRTSLHSKRTLDAIGTFDAVWMLTNVVQSLALKHENAALRHALLSGCDISVVATHCDAIPQTEAKFNEVNEIVQKTLLACLGYRDTQNQQRGRPRNVLSAEESEAITARARIIVSGMAFISSKEGDPPIGLEPLRERLRLRGVTQQKHVNDLEETLRQLEANCLFDNEPCLLPPVDALAVHRALTQVLDRCDYQGDALAKLAEQVVEHCEPPTWPTDGRTINSIMRDHPGRRGVCCHGKYDIPRDIANKWGSIMMLKSNSLMQGFKKTLRTIEAQVASDDILLTEVQREGPELLSYLRRMSHSMMTGNVRALVEGYMRDNNFFIAGRTDRNVLPTPREIQDIMQTLVNQLAVQVNILRNRIAASRIVSERVHDTLTPQLREELRHIFQLNQQAVVYDDEYTFICPISLEPMETPVQLISDTYLIFRVDKIVLHEDILDAFTIVEVIPCESFSFIDGTWCGDTRNFLHVIVIVLVRLQQIGGMLPGVIFTTRPTVKMVTMMVLQANWNWKSCICSAADETEC
jgi:hypothetical protein